MKFRNEHKFEITNLDAINLRNSLDKVMKKDAHCINGNYHVRSVYFDNVNEDELKKKINGISFREKFRIRYYNNDTKLLFLEKKSKINGFCSKTKTNISISEAEQIFKGTYCIMPKTTNKLLAELYAKMKINQIYPKTIVDYDREAYIFPAGNVRVTIDSNIRTGLRNTDFLNPNIFTIPACQNKLILEIKWDEFLPTLIKDIIPISNLYRRSFSKYAMCCNYN